ncbi:MAG: hypothetical protein H6P98_1101 [Candidatus Aminicenantes bacterium]|nr:hypothetical protein [Candidatus Aminicenantes bacterium]
MSQIARDGSRSQRTWLGLRSWTILLVCGGPNMSVGETRLRGWPRWT